MPRKTIKQQLAEARQQGKDAEKKITELEALWEGNRNALQVARLTECQWSEAAEEALRRLDYNGRVSTPNEFVQQHSKAADNLLAQHDKIKHGFAMQVTILQEVIQGLTHDILNH